MHRHPLVGLLGEVQHSVLGWTWFQRKVTYYGHQALAEVPGPRQSW